MFTEKISSIGTTTFMLSFLLLIFIVGIGIPFALDTITRYEKEPVKVTIMKNCCDTGYCIKTLDEKVIQKISTKDGVRLDTINYSFELVSEYDVFGVIVDKQIKWKKN